jgi:hypothetical protein
VLAVAVALAMLTAPALAQAPAPAAEPPPESGVESVPGSGDTWLGGLAAIGCGFMVRATIATAGTQVGTVAGAVACCGYMLFDAFVVEGSR